MHVSRKTWNWKGSTQSPSHTKPITVNVLKLCALLACQKVLDKEHRPRSDCFFRSSLIRVFLFAILTSILWIPALKSRHKKKQLFVAFPLGSNQFRRDGLWCVCLLYDGSSRRLNRKWFYGEAGNRTCDPWFARHSAYPLHHGGFSEKQTHGWKFKISKILNFRNSNFQTCRMPIKMNTFKFKWLIEFR